MSIQDLLTPEMINSQKKNKLNPSYSNVWAVSVNKKKYVSKVPTFGSIKNEMFYRELDLKFKFGVTLPTYAIGRYVITPFTKSRFDCDDSLWVDDIKTALIGGEILQLCRIHYLDFLVGNTDRHLGNILFTKKGLKAIDNEIMRFKVGDEDFLFTYNYLRDLGVKRVSLSKEVREIAQKLSNSGFGKKLGKNNYQKFLDRLKRKKFEISPKGAEIII